MTGMIVVTTNVFDVCLQEIYFCPVYVYQCSMQFFIQSWNEHITILILWKKKGKLYGIYEYQGRLNFEMGPI